MALPMTYSRRKRLRDNEGRAAELRSHPFGQKLLQQLFMLFDQIDNEINSYQRHVLSQVVHYLRNDMGRPQLWPAKTVREEFFNWWMNESNIDQQQQHDYRLDTVELFCTVPWDVIRSLVSTEPRLRYGAADNIRKHIQTINDRMTEDGFGYQFESGQVVEVTSQLMHQEAIVPLLGLTNNKAFAAVDQEFRDALSEFRSGNYDDCVADCGNALESALKVIAAAKQWLVKPDDTGSKLINVAYEQGLIPAHMQSQFTGLRSVLMGIPTMRNREGGHGSGTEPRSVEKHFAEYQLHQTAAAILFLVKCSQ